MSKFKVGDQVKIDYNGNAHYILEVLEVDVDRYFVNTEMAKPFRGRVLSGSTEYTLCLGETDYFDEVDCTLHKPVEDKSIPHYALMVEYFTNPHLIIEEWDKWGNEWAIVEHPYWTKEGADFRAKPGRTPNPNAIIAMLWALDTNQKLQYRNRDDVNDEWQEVEEPSFSPIYEYRLKPVIQVVVGSYFSIDGVVLVIAKVESQFFTGIVVKPNAEFSVVGEKITFTELPSAAIPLDDPFSAEGK